MKLYSTISSERASKGQGGNEYIDIDLHDENRVHIARLVFMQDANDARRYILVEDCFFRSDKLEIRAYQTYEQIPLKELENKRGKRQKGETDCEKYGCSEQGHKCVPF